MILRVTYQKKKTRKDISIFSFSCSVSSSVLYLYIIFNDVFFQDGVSIRVI